MMFTLCSSQNHISIKCRGLFKRTNHSKPIHPNVYTIHDTLVIFPIPKEPTRTLACTLTETLITKPQFLNIHKSYLSLVISELMPS